MLGPGRRVAHGHEYTVGQDGDHDEHAEQRQGRVKESEGTGGESRWTEGPLTHSTWLGLPPTPLCPGTRSTWAGYE